MATLTKAFYESDTGSVHLMKLDSTTVTAGGTQPTSTTISDIRPKLSKSNREFGLRPRYVVIGRTFGTAPDTFIKYRKIPVFQATTFAGTTFALGATVTIGTQDWEVVSRFPEDY